MSHGMSRIATVTLVSAVLVLSTVAAATEPAVEVTSLTDELPGGVGGVAVDRLGFLYVADFGERVWKIDPFGQVEVFADALYGASGNAVDESGDLWQSSFYGGTLTRFGRDGTPTVVAWGLEGPVGVVVSEDGVAVVCECQANRLARVAADGTVSVLATSDLFQCPNGITRGPDGTIYVVNFRDGRVLEVDEAGSVDEVVALPSFGNGHVVWGAGALWVTGFRSNRLYRVAPDGSFEVVAGSGRFAAEDGAGEEASFANPNGVAYDPVREVLYTNDFLTPFAERTTSPKRSVVRRIALPGLAVRVRAALADGGVDAAVAAYHEYKDAHPQRSTEIEVNGLGYGLMAEGSLDAALAVFELNTQDYPRSFNTWDSLAEAWMAKGDRDKAIRFYRRSLELNPGNRNALAKLEELGAE